MAMTLDRNKFSIIIYLCGNLSDVLVLLSLRSLSKVGCGTKLIQSSYLVVNWD